MGVSDSETQIIQTGPGEAGGRPQRAIGASSRPRVTAAPRTPGGRSLTALSPAAGGEQAPPELVLGKRVHQQREKRGAGEGLQGALLSAQLFCEPRPA